jgi:hypothetical protein
MQTLDQPKTAQTIPTSTQTAAPGAERINEAFHDAQATSQDAVFKAITCGNLLIEQRDAMHMCQRDTCKGLHYNRFDPNKPEADKFFVWLTANCPDIPRRKAYRWMEVAFTVISFLELGPNGGAPLSWQLADSNSPAFNALQEYICGKTMRDCLDGVINGGDPSHRLTRAQNGMEKGGTRGEDRKDWPTFIGRKLKDLSSHFSHWDKFTGPQIEKTETALKKAIAAWPTPILEFVREEAGKVVRERPDTHRK